MLAELLARSGKVLLDSVPPDGRKYWAARFWDRAAAEQHPLLREHFLSQKDTIGKYLEKYGAETGQVLEFACGTGEFTGLAATRTAAKSITALDISQQGLDIVRGRVQHEDLKLVLGDFWAEHDLGTADLVMCVDAIHHLGDVREVLQRLKTFMAPGGIFVGNLWTRDNFHDFERKRYGTFNHLRRTAGFFSTAVVIRASGGRMKTGAYRTQLLTSAEGTAILNDVFGEVLELDVHPHFMSFVATA
ncbi:class I SAM-dependent methyltransferase [Amycolatopsis sp. NPDC051758]|jgi:SAM-dependent methyltransferase|uniref:class I SAM-dependent methyltransferase n=1 Tax=Amycolatopsis sp. NPDC051758 TaxID=3363935 RepID=UPI0037B98898